MLGLLKKKPQEQDQTQSSDDTFYEEALENGVFTVSSSGVRTLNLFEALMNDKARERLEKILEHKLPDDLTKV